MKTIYFVRQGESEANVSDIAVGESAPLTEKGRKQARFIAGRASKLPIDLIVASTMTRALETAAVISERIGKPYERSDLFRERRWPSSVNGKNKKDKDVTDFLQRWFATLYSNGRVEDGENFEDVKARSQAAFRYLETRSEQHILVATHGFFVRVMLALVLLGDTLTSEELFQVASRVKTENTGISVFEYHLQEAKQFDDYVYKGWRVRVWNDHAHLG